MGRKIIGFVPEILTQAFATGKSWHVQIVEGLPPDAQITWVELKRDLTGRDAIWLYVDSAQWPPEAPAGEGGRLPTFDLTLMQLDEDARVKSDILTTALTAASDQLDGIVRRICDYWKHGGIRESQAVYLLDATPTRARDMALELNIDIADGEQQPATIEDDLRHQVEAMQAHVAKMEAMRSEELDEYRVRLTAVAAQNDYLRTHAFDEARKSYEERAVEVVAADRVHADLMKAREANRKALAWLENANQHAPLDGAQDLIELLTSVLPASK